MNDFTRAVTGQFVLCCAILMPIGLLIPFSPTSAQGKGVEELDSSLSQRVKTVQAAPIQTIDDADEVLRLVSQLRKEVDSVFATEEQICAQRFFVTSCMNDAKERRRVAIKLLRTQEVQANAFKRAYKADNRDKSLDEKSTKPSKDQSFLDTDQTIAATDSLHGKHVNRSIEGQPPFTRTTEKSVGKVDHVVSQFPLAQMEKQGRMRTDLATGTQKENNVHEGTFLVYEKQVTPIKKITKLALDDAATRINSVPILTMP